MIEDYDNEDYDYFKEWDIEQYKKEIERLHSIIKEVREYIMSELITEWDIKNNGCVSGSDLLANEITPILEILNKVEE